MTSLQPIDTLKSLNTQSEKCEKSVKSGEVIFREGEQAEILYGLLAGTVALSINGKPIEKLQAGDVFGEGALLHNDKLRASTAIAETDCLLLEVNREHFMFAVQQTPMFALELLKSYSDRLRRVKDKLHKLL
ncbi:MAG: cyclic nucleotide-binding domain-containing protein [Microcystaceae cyanobacterium]